MIVPDIQHNYRAVPDLNFVFSHVVSPVYPPPLPLLLRPQQFGTHKWYLLYIYYSYSSTLLPYSHSGAWYVASVCSDFVQVYGLYPGLSVRDPQNMTGACLLVTFDPDPMHVSYISAWQACSLPLVLPRSFAAFAELTPEDFPADLYSLLPPLHHVALAKSQLCSWHIRTKFLGGLFLPVVIQTYTTFKSSL